MPLMAYQLLLAPYFCNVQFTMSSRLPYFCLTPNCCWLPAVAVTGAVLLACLLLLAVPGTDDGIPAVAGIPAAAGIPTLAGTVDVIHAVAFLLLLASLLLITSVIFMLPRLLTTTLLLPMFS
jgi:hypothetical protein